MGRYLRINYLTSEKKSVHSKSHNVVWDWKKGTQNISLVSEKSVIMIII